MSCLFLAPSWVPGEGEGWEDRVLTCHIPPPSYHTLGTRMREKRSICNRGLIRRSPWGPKLKYYKWTNQVISGNMLNLSFPFNEISDPHPYPSSSWTAKLDMVSKVTSHWFLGVLLPPEIQWKIWKTRMPSGEKLREADRQLFGKANRKAAPYST